MAGLGLSRPLGSCQPTLHPRLCAPLLSLHGFRGPRRGSLTTCYSRPPPLPRTRRPPEVLVVDTPEEMEE